jgi:hypothetical protein
VRVAQRVQHTLHGVVRLPVIVHDNAGDLRQQLAPRSLPLRRRGPPRGSK